jgi:hypothetical protein
MYILCDLSVGVNHENLKELVLIDEEWASGTESHNSIGQPVAFQERRAPL